MFFISWTRRGDEDARAEVTQDLLKGQSNGKDSPTWTNHPKMGEGKEDAGVSRKNVSVPEVTGI